MDRWQYSFLKSYFVCNGYPALYEFDRKTAFFASAYFILLQNTKSSFNKISNATSFIFRLSYAILF